MTDTKRDFDEELWLVTTALAQSISETSDEEILEDYHSAGEDPEIAARSTREFLLGTVRLHRRKKAALEYAQATKALTKPQDHLPESPEGRVELLTAVLARSPQLRSGLTTHFRDLKELTDADITSYLRHLSSLGALEDLKNIEPEDTE